MLVRRRLILLCGSDFFFATHTSSCAHLSSSYTLKTGRNTTCRFRSFSARRETFEGETQKASKMVMLPYLYYLLVVLAWGTGGIAASWSNLDLVAASPRTMDADALILGGGISGIAAARTLRDAGKSFLVLEAMDRIGGRIRDTMMGETRVELGANWLEGLDPELCPSKCHSGAKPALVNPIYSLVVNSKLNFTCTNERSLKVYERGGRLVPSRQAGDVRYSDRLFSCVEAEWRKFPGRDISAREALRNCGWRPKSTAEELIDWFAHDFYFTQTPESSSCAMAYPLQTYADFGTCSVFVVDQSGGYARIVHDLARDVMDSVRVNTVVDEIRWHDNGTRRVCVSTSDRVTGGKSEYCASRAIITFSLGVLQSSEMQAAFHPPLPAAKLTAINELHMGYYLKIFLRFDKTFWDTDVQFIGHASTQRGHYPLFQPLNSRDGHFLPADTHIIVATVTGSEALRISRQPKSVTEEELLSVLGFIYPHHDARLLEIVVPDWNVNPFFRGSYSNAPLLKDSGFPDLSTPVGPLYFSGEATSKYYGFVHGAFVAGVETAGTLLEDMANCTVQRNSRVYGL